jgi:hypothetical protein
MARRRQVTERIPQANHRKVSHNHYIIAANVFAVALILVALVRTMGGGAMTGCRFRLPS